MLDDLARVAAHAGDTVLALVGQAPHRRPKYQNGQPVPAVRPAAMIRLSLRLVMNIITSAPTRGGCCAVPC